MNIDVYLPKLIKLQKFYIDVKPIIDELVFDDNGIVYKGELHKTPFYANDWFISLGKSNISISFDEYDIHLHFFGSVSIHSKTIKIKLDEDFNIIEIDFGVNKFIINEKDIGNINSLENLSEDDLFYLYLQKSYA